MPAYSKILVQKYMKSVRELLVIDPSMTLEDMQRYILERHNHKVEIATLSRWVHKIAGEQERRIDPHNPRMLKDLAKFQDTMLQLSTQMWAIVMNPRASYTSKVLAANAIRSNKESEIKAMITAGIYSPVAGATNNRIPEISDTTVADLNEAFRTWFRTPVPNKTSYIEATLIEVEKNEPEKPKPDPNVTITPNGGTITRRDGLN